jgi:hypothetical protein
MAQSQPQPYPADKKKSMAAVALERSPELRESAASGGLFEKLRDGLKRVTIDGEEYFIAEGDTLLDADQLAIYALNRQRVAQAREAAAVADRAGLGLQTLDDPDRTALVAVTQGGKIVRWKPGLVLSYRVVKNTFADVNKFNLVVDAMKKATKDWQDTCGITFQHRPDLDAAPGVGAAGALFAVREIDANGDFIASAFFPNDPVDRRRVLIDPSFYADDLGFNKIGVLRHELGHVLGFRHEHIRSEAPPACPNEPQFDTANLSLYDPKSVMHYFCGGVGNPELAISAIDVTSSRKVYGLPLSDFTLLE